MQTEIIKIEDISRDAALIEKAGEMLRSGGLVAIPTETVYGLAANALDGEAVKKIFLAKGRPQDNPLIVHVADISQIPPLVKKMDERVYALAEKYWPGPLTVIMEKSAIIPDEVSAGLDTVAVRIPSNPVANAVIRAAGVPLAAPSANSSGKPSPTRASHVIEDMDGKIDMIIDAGKSEIGVESTVVTLAEGKPRLLRPGGITLEQLEEVLGETLVDKAVFSKLGGGEKASSPGMKYKHYAPKAEVTILKGSLESAAQFVNSLGEDVCVMCFDGESGRFNCRCIEYGAEHDSLSQAEKIFDALRRVDEMGCEKAYVRCPSANGVGLAVYNRLLRSAAFRVKNLESRMPVIGLTGQTGAGKTTVSAYLAEQGFYVIDTDILARKAVENKDVLLSLCEEFGNDILLPDGSLDRKKTAQRAFASKEKTRALNDITHPVITAMVHIELEKAQVQGAKGAVIDAAALLESPITQLCTVTASVLAPLEERLERIIKRDGITREQAMLRISAQYPDEYYKEKTDIIIENANNSDYRKDVARLIETCYKGKDE